MKKTKILSLFLCFALLISLILPATVASAAEDSDNGMKISKTAIANSDGNYTITLEAYATGSKVITETKKDVPTDIVLVLDQSGSMANDIGTVSFSEYSSNQSTNAQHYARRHNGGDANLYYPLGNDAYAPVSVMIQQDANYTEITNGRNNDDGSNAINYWNNSENLYALVNGEYQKVTVTRSNRDSNRNRTYYYYLNYGTNDQILIGSAYGNTASPNFGSYGPLYLLSVDETQNVYTYTYVDANGETQTIGTPSTGANTKFDTKLYQRIVSTSGGGSRLNALKTAVTTFANSVKTKSAGVDGILGNDDDVNHRIAVVGFATGDYSSNSDYPTYENTELFIGTTQYNYNVNAASYYASALQDMNTQAGYDNVIASKNALAARGATYTNYGMMMANSIFAANPIQSGERRNRVVVVFTDGMPGYSSYDSDVAEKAITQGNTTKNTYGATVYTVGIFSGADASTAGNSGGTDTQKANWFMQNLSSNNGKVQNPSYYLSAADAKTLNNIFQQISDQIESGGSTATLSSETVIKDIISPSFTLPEGTSAADITLETYHCTGKNGDVYTWSKNETEMGAEATVDGDQVSVTGFDFKANYVGTVTKADGTVEYRGDKLVISFKVSPKDGFLGGNDVYTNTKAGVYENAEASEPVLTFERPQVNVPIKDVSITAGDINVYLLGSLTAEQIRSGVSVKVGDVVLSLDPTKDNYGLADWQTEYVTIALTILDENNIPVTNLDALTSDKTYSISVSVTPKTVTHVSTEGEAAVEKTGSDSFSINVFKPMLTFQDGTVDYGSAITATGYVSDKTNKTYDLDNYASSKLQWMHGVTDANSVTMFDSATAPVLTKTYQYDTAADKVDSTGKVVSTDIVGVDVTVKIGENDVTQYVSFAHDACGFEDCSWDTDKGNFEFLLHVINKCADLTIIKGGIETIDNDGSREVQSVIFHIKGKDSGIEMDIVIAGNGQKVIKDLPIDTYTVTENTGWSWRYTPDAVAKDITLDAGTVNSLTFSNCRTDTLWLNGGAYTHNVFGK